MNSSNRHRHSSDGVGPRSNLFGPHLQRNSKRQADSLSLSRLPQSCQKTFVSARCELTERCSSLVRLPKATYIAETRRPVSSRRILTSFGQTTSQFEFSIQSNHSEVFGHLLVFAPARASLSSLMAASFQPNHNFKRITGPLETSSSPKLEATVSSREPE